MNPFRRFFLKNPTECPRCLGKGHVDWEDIRRMKKQLKWIPGRCAYCEGVGKVSAGMISKLPADTTYLTTSLPSGLQKKLRNANAESMEKAREYDLLLTEVIDFIRRKYVAERKSAGQIADDYLESDLHQLMPFSKADFIGYAHRVIELMNAELN